MNCHTPECSPSALSLLAIFVYVWFRFEWHFALGAILATIHDVLLLLGMFVVFQMEFNLWSIAALLAIVGYSLNDTVVIYDRVRENLRRYGSEHVIVGAFSMLRSTRPCRARF